MGFASMNQAPCEQYFVRVVHTYLPNLSKPQKAVPRATGIMHPNGQTQITPSGKTDPDFKVITLA
jgi:hypothetical protein